MGGVELEKIQPELVSGGRWRLPALFYLGALFAISVSEAVQHIEDKTMGDDLLLAECAATCAIARRAREEMAAARADLNTTRTEMREILAIAHNTRPADWFTSEQPDMVTPFSRVNHNSHEAAYHAATVIRAILDEFPLDWQVAILKALGARTALAALQRQQAPPTLSA